MLADADDVANELGLINAGAFSQDQTLRVPALLAKASYLFQKAADRLFTPDTYTVRLKVSGGRVRIPESPVVSVNSVVDDAGNDVPWTRFGQWLTVEPGRTLNNSFEECPPDINNAFVTVTYAGGEIPDVVRFAVAQTAARYVNVDPAVAAGAKSVQRTVGPFQSNITYADWATETVCLSAEDRLLAESFRYKGTQLVVQRP